MIKKQHQETGSEKELTNRTRGQSKSRGTEDRIRVGNKAALEWKGKDLPYDQVQEQVDLPTLW